MSSSLTGRTIGPYLVGEKLGHGGMAEVYRAHQPSLNRDVAIKVLTGALAQDQEFIRRFRREAMAAGALGHSNILTIFDAGTTADGLQYIVMEYAPGGTLKDLLERGPLPPAKLVEIGAQLAEALHAAHEQGIVHRDIKPSNILFTRDGRPLLMDFGVSLTGADTRLTHTGMAVGTPEYMSPEQAQGLNVDRRSDVYSLGVVLYEMATGALPFSGDTPLATLYQQVHADLPTAALHTTGAPPWVIASIERALAKSPDDRFASAGDLGRSLRQEAPLPPPPDGGRIHDARTAMYEGSAIPSHPAPQDSVPQPGRRRGRGLMWMAIALIGALAAASSTYALFFRPDAGGLPAIRSLFAGEPSADIPTATVVVDETVVARAVTATLAHLTAVASESSASTPTQEANPTATVDAQATQHAESRTAEQTATAEALGTETASRNATATTQAAEQSAATQAAATQTAAARTAATQVAASSQATAEARSAESTRIAQEEATATAASAAVPTATPRPPTPTTVVLRTNDISGFETDDPWRRGDEPNGSLVRSQEQAHSGSSSGKLTYDFRSASNDYVVFLHHHPLPGEPDQLHVWVFGDGSGHFLNAWVRDNKGQVWQAPFGRINHTGWAPMSATVRMGQKWPWGHISGPRNGKIDYPIDFAALVLDDAPDDYSGTGVIYLDDLRAAGAGVAQPAATPLPAQAPTSAAPPSSLTGTLVFSVFNPQRGKYDVYAASVDGTNRRLVMQEARQPDFRPDGLVALNGDGGGRDNVWSMDTYGGGARAISLHPEDAHPSWSGDGGRLAFDSLLGPDKSAPRIYVHDDLSGAHEPRMVMFGSYEIRGRVSCWLDDGRIVFNGCDYWDTGSRCGLYAVSDVGGQPSRLTDNGSDTAADHHGARIAFMTSRDGNWEVYLMSWDGSNQRNLSQSPHNDGLPTWSPDGQWIAFASDRGGAWAIWAMRPDGGQAQQLFALEGGFGAGDYDWSLEKISWGP